MNATETTTRSNASRLPWRLCVLCSILLLAGLVLIPVGVFLFGSSVQVALLAWLVCSLSAVFAHFGSEFPRGDMNFAARLAIQMVVRTVPPFALAIWGVKFAMPPLETSLVFYILAFYLAGLIADIQLQLGQLNAGVGKIESTGN